MLMMPPRRHDGEALGPKQFPLDAAVSEHADYTVALKLARFGIGRRTPGLAAAGP
jgi:hypothetical protein